jgi:hypothetical protein
VRPACAHFRARYPRRIGQSQHWTDGLNNGLRKPRHRYGVGSTEVDPADDAFTCRRFAWRCRMNIWFRRPSARLYEDSRGYLLFA